VLGHRSKFDLILSHSAACYVRNVCLLVMRPFRDHPSVAENLIIYI
jgi:hypothetical protein